MDKITVERSIWIEAPRERVWAAVTEPDELAQWFLPPALGARLQRDDRGVISVLMGPMAVDLARLEDVDPPRRLTSRTLPDQLIATTYALEDEQGGTRLTVTLTGFEALPPEAAQERIGPSGMGWEKALQNLKAYLAGTPLPYPEGFIAAMFGYRREGLEQIAVERSIWVKAPRERVWQAVTDPQQIQQWFSPGTAWRLSAMQVGGRLSTVDAETGADSHIQVIEVLDPPRLFVTRTAPPEPTHTTTWRLEEEQGGTRLTVTEAGYELDDPDTRHNAMEQNAFGFGMMMENFRAYVEGQELPYPWGF